MHAATYYFSTSGNDANSGNGPSVPKQTLAAAEALALPGNVLLFKRGDAWYDPFNSFDLQYVSGTATNPVVIDAYPSTSDPRPIIAALRKLNDAVGSAPNQWKLAPPPAPTNTWQQSVGGFSHALRLFANNVSKYQVNRSELCANETDVNQPHLWYLKPTEPGSAGIVYVNTGSSTAPQNVEIHPMGSVTTLKMKGTHHVTVRNIDFRGGSADNVIWIEAPCSNITIEGCTVQRANGSGIVVMNSGSVPSQVVSNITIRNNTVDKVWTSQENDDAILLRGDGIFFLHAVQGGLIQNNVVRNWGHCGITLTSHRAGFPGVHGVIVEENKVTAGASGYMHAFDVNGFEDLTTDNTIRRNFFHDYQATCHAQGNGNKYYSNIFARVTMTTMDLHSKQPFGLDMIPWQFSDGNWMVAHDNLVANNTFYDIERYAIVLGDSPSNPSEVHNNLFYNNLIVNYGDPAGTDVGLSVASTVRGDTYVRFNNFWDSSASSPLTAAVATYLNPLAPNYTAAQLNSNFPNYCSGNLQMNPLLQNPANNEFNLTASSPQALRAGGMVIPAGLAGAGFVDYFGNPWHSQSPSIGAIQVP